MTQEIDLSTRPRSRRNLLAVAGAGAAAALASHVSGGGVRAGHDGTTVMHVGESNVAPSDRETELVANVDGAALRVRNEHLSDGAAAVAGASTNGDGIHGDSENFHGVFGHSTTDLGVFGTSGADAPPGAGVRGHSEHGDGVQGFSTTGRGVTGDSESAPGGAFRSESEFGVEGRSTSSAGVAGFGVVGPGVHGASQTGPGVDGHSSSGPAGTFTTDDGESIVQIGGRASSFALGVHNELAAEEAGGILATSGGGKPGIESDVFPFGAENPGVGVQGVAYLGTNYENGTFGAGPGTGVQGISGTGTGVQGQSASHFGVHGESTDSVGVIGFSANDVGVFGFGTPEGDGDGVGGFSPNSVGGRFGSGSGIGLRAISPGEEHPALQAASGTIADSHFEADPDGGLALEVIGKARFSTAGAGMLPQGQVSVFVAQSAVTDSSHITVTPTGDPGNRQVRWVDRDPGVGFTVHFSSSPPSQRPETPFTYLVVEPGGG